MSDSELHTTLLHGYLDRLQAGDDVAYDELIRQTRRRLEFLAHRMLGHFPAVRRWEESQDVLQGALMRLLLDLRDKGKRPASVRDFFNLAANRMRSVLLSLHRHYQGPLGLGRHHASGIRPAGDQETTTGPDPADPAPAAAELERWGAFHEAVEKLPAEEREVVGLIFYHGWTQAEVAELLGVSDRMVRKHWAKACVHLKRALGDALPTG
jgi:RNA polymerase sigma factor (sigma-70 family)